MAVEIGALRALLSLDSAAFERGAKRAQASMTGLERSLNRTGERMRSIGKRMSASITVPIAAGVGLLMRSSLQSAAEIQRMAGVANAGTTEFQKFAAGAKSVGIEQDKLADILKDVNDRVGDFISSGGGEMKDFFEKIGPKVGVTAAQFAKLSGPEALQLYVSSLEKAGASQQEMTFYLESMASDATLLLPLLRNNGAEMERLGDRAKELGAIMDEKTIASLNRSNSALRDLGRVGSALSNQLTAALAPAFEALVETMTSVAQWFSALAPQMRTLIVVAVGVAAAIGPVLIGLGLMASGMSVAIGATRALIAALFTMRGALMATGIGVAVVAAGLLANWFLKLVERTGGWGAALGLLGDVASAVWQGIVDSAAAIPPALNGVWEKMKAGFLRALSGMATSFHDLVWSLGNAANGAGMEGLGESLMGVAGAANDVSGTLMRAAGAAEASARGSFSTAAATISSAFGPARSAVAALGAETASATAGMDDAASAAAALAAALDGVAGDGGAGGGGAGGGAADKAAKALKKVKTEAEKTAESMKKKFDEVADSIGNAMAGAIVQGKSMGQALGRVFQQIAQDLIASGISKMIKSLFGGKGGGGDWIGSAIASIFGGARATGGPVSSGRAYLVGERGPEMIIPNSSGTVIPNHKLGGDGGGRSGPVQISINVSGARGNSEIRDMVSQGVRAGLGEYDRSVLPGRVQQIGRDPRKMR